MARRLRVALRVWTVAGFLMLSAAWAQGDTMPGRFSETGLDGWQMHEFSGQTLYQLVSQGDRRVLRASSAQSASALVFRRKVDLHKTPYLNWSWRKLEAFDPGDENSKSGDDFVARVYVIRDGGVFFWKTRALNYVWSHHHNRGDVWDNPFAGDRARMLSLRDATDPAGGWVSEQRNVARDVRELLGEEYRYIDGVAIMTDTDNSGLSASAEYGDIWFSAEP